MASPGDIHKLFVQAWNKRDFATFRKLLAADYSYVGADGKELKGPDAGVAAAKGFAEIFPDAQTKIISMYDSGNVSVGEFITTGTQENAFMGIPATSKSVMIQRCNIITVSNDLISSEHDYTNLLSVLLQIGATVAPPPPPQPAPQP
jgi:steroid delta-isomerase-like uncharacterized protein